MLYVTITAAYDTRSTRSGWLRTLPARLFGLALLLLATTLGSGCASIDFDYPKTASTAPTDTQDTRLGRLAENLPDAPPGAAPFYPIPDGVEALSVRVLMAQAAERTIDAQYYLITDDITGYLFLRELLRAADRGVRVRLLLDDIQTKGYGAGMRALSAHPNFELRIFNPFVQRSWRGLSVLTGDLRRVNRRMHNKSFTVDNQATVIGGRNIAAEYFGAHDLEHFGDLDLLGLGPIAQDVSSMFDQYWNDRLAVPVAALTGEPQDPESELAAMREHMETALKDVETSPYGGALSSSALEVRTREPESLLWAPYDLVFDPPRKADARRPDDLETIVTPLVEIVMGAESELFVLSPYFVPRKPALEGFRTLRERGVKTTVVTNSLAANNHSVVHAGYMGSRKPLLELGVELYEVRPDAVGRGPNLGDPPTIRSTLHTKAFIVDRRWVFIGSFNWDPRSAHINTEMGILLDSPELAAEFLEEATSVLDTSTYRVVLNDAGYLRWVTEDDGQEVVWDKEPRTGFWKRVRVQLMRLLPIKGQL